MRMWMVDPRGMCRNHLLGEHKEIHMLIGALRLNKNIRGYIEKRLVEPFSIVLRHEALVDEFCRRGYQHFTPVNVDALHDAMDRNITPFSAFFTRVPRKKSLEELHRRCQACRERSKR